MKNLNKKLNKLLKSQNKSMLSEYDFIEIINIPRDSWIEFIKSKFICEYDLNKNITSLLNTKENISLFFNLEELNIFRFPILVGDIVTHKDFGGKYVVYDYPITDERYKIKKDYLKFRLYDSRLFYKVDGFLNDGLPSGFNRNNFEEFQNINVLFDNKQSLSDVDCYWRNWIKISDITKEPDDSPFWDYLLGYYDTKEKVYEERIR